MNEVVRIATNLILLYIPGWIFLKILFKSVSDKSFHIFCVVISVIFYWAVTYFSENVVSTVSYVICLALILATFLNILLRKLELIDKLKILLFRETDNSVFKDIVNDPNGSCAYIKLKDTKKHLCGRLGPYDHTNPVKYFTLELEENDLPEEINKAYSLRLIDIKDVEEFYVEPEHLRKEHQKMARAKKDGKFLNIYIERKILEKLEAYCEKTGLTKTKSVERILEQFLKQN